MLTLRALPRGRIPLSGGDSETRSEEHTSELQSLTNLVCRLLLEKKKEYAMILASEPAAKKYLLSIKARVLGMAIAGAVPALMIMAPDPASRKVLEEDGLKISQNR